MDAIRKAANMFHHHAAPQNSGCGLQAKFLQNVLRVFRKAQEVRPGRNAQPTHPHGSSQHQYPPQEMADGRAHVALNTSEVTHVQVTETNAGYAMQGEEQEGDLSNYDNNPFGLHEFSFADDEIWANLFADAGFNIAEGVFLPYGDNDIGNMGPPT